MVVVDMVLVAVVFAATGLALVVPQEVAIESVALDWAVGFGDDSIGVSAVVAVVVAVVVVVAAVVEAAIVVVAEPVVLEAEIEPNSVVKVSEPVC